MAPKKLNSKTKKPKHKLQSVIIAVMGPTGSGKTTFINTVSGSEMRVGKGLESETACIQLSQPFALDGYLVTLVDTPGFDDTTKSDADILSIVADHLTSTFKKGQRLSGVIYLHRISDNRMGGTALRNFKMFRELCGPEALSNAAIVLNMWDKVNANVRSAREEELVGKDMFFKPAIDGGAQVFHHENTVKSASEILIWLSKRPPKPLLIQKELVDQQKPIYETSAGVALLGELALKERRHAEQLKEVQREIEEAIRQKDDEDRKELEEARRKLEAARNNILQQQATIRAAKPQPRSAAKGWFRFLRSLGCY